MFGSSFGQATQEFWNQVQTGRATGEREVKPMRDYELISTDLHLEVPPYVWEPYVDKQFREFVLQLFFAETQIA